MNTNQQPIKIFGHVPPDTDTVVSAIVYAWFYNNVLQKPAEAYVLGDLNPETAYVLERFGVTVPPLLPELTEEDQIVLVDTNNFDELPDSVEKATLLEIVDHHKLFGNLSTKTPVTITMRTMASTASLIYTLMNPELHPIPEKIAGLMLAGLLSDTLEYRSPTTTDEDREIGKALEKLSGVDAHDLATAMFEAKSDISDLSYEQVIEMDSKIFTLSRGAVRVSVVETTNPASLLAKRTELEAAMNTYVDSHDDIDDLILFVIDILNQNATPVAGTESAKALIEAAFDVILNEETTLDGVVSRKKQIAPALQAVA